MAIHLSLDRLLERLLAARILLTGDRSLLDMGEAPRGRGDGLTWRPMGDRLLRLDRLGEWPGEEDLCFSLLRLLLFFLRGELLLDRDLGITVKLDAPWKRLRFYKVSFDALTISN